METKLKITPVEDFQHSLSPICYCERQTFPTVSGSCGLRLKETGSMSTTPTYTTHDKDLQSRDPAHEGTAREESISSQDTGYSKDCPASTLVRES